MSPVTIKITAEGEETITEVVGNRQKLDIGFDVHQPNFVSSGDVIVEVGTLGENASAKGSSSDREIRVTVDEPVNSGILYLGVTPKKEFKVEPRLHGRETE